MDKKIRKGVIASWTPTCVYKEIGKGPHKVIIIGNDHGRVYCTLNGQEYGDYGSAFLYLEDTILHSRQ